MILTFQNRPLLPLIVARKLNPELEDINNINDIKKNKRASPDARI